MKPKKKVKWVINLNDNSEVCVSVGNKVYKDQILVKWRTKKIRLFHEPNLLRLSSKCWQEINQESKGKLLTKGELIYKSGGLFSKKIKAPENGLFLEVDEFGDIKMEMVEDKIEETRSPINGKVVKIDNDKLIIEFGAVEYKGESLVEGKAWGESNFKLVNRVVGLSYEHKGQIILTEEINQVFLSKAGVLGVEAILTNNKEVDTDKITTNLPILALEKSDWDEIINFDKEKREVLVNSKTGRLLVVVE